MLPISWHRPEGQGRGGHGSLTALFGAERFLLLDPVHNSSIIKKRALSISFSFAKGNYEDTILRLKCFLHLSWKSYREPI